MQGRRKEQIAELSDFTCTFHLFYILGLHNVLFKDKARFWVGGK